MANPVLDFGAFSAPEKQTLLTTAKAEYVKRITGRVTQGSSAAQSYGLNLMEVGDLIRLINGLSADLGLNTVETRVAPNFNRTGLTYNPSNPLGYS
jgi:hypothetical protein